MKVVQRVESVSHRNGGILMGNRLIRCTLDHHDGGGDDEDFKAVAVKVFQRAEVGVGCVSHWNGGILMGNRLIRRTLDHHHDGGDEDDFKAVAVKVVQRAVGSSRVRVTLEWWHLNGELTYKAHS